MQRHTHLACLLVVSAAIVGCHLPSTPPPTSSTPKTPATTPAPVAVHQPSTQAIDQTVATNVGDPAKLREVMTAIQQAVQQHDTAAVAALISYPIDINPRTSQVLHIPTPTAFLAHYDSIITPHIVEVIQKQRYENLFVNYQGAMFGNGELWLAGICRDEDCRQTDIKIRTIQNTEGKAK